jgi:hypothetical protein
MRETRIKWALSRCFAVNLLKLRLSHFVAKFANVLKVPLMVVDSGRDKNATKAAHDDNPARRVPA